MSYTTTWIARAARQALLALILGGAWQLAIADTHEETIQACSVSQCFGIDWKQPPLQEVRKLSPDLRDANGSSPLHYAVRNCVPPSHAHSLVLAGADVNEVEPATGYTPLQLSLIICRSPMLELLLNLGADPDAPVAEAEGGGNVLHLAIKRKRPRIILQRLIKSHINLDAVDDEGLTPLVLVLADGDLELAKLLLDAGANPNATDKQQITPAHYAAQKLDHDLLGKLVRHGAVLDVYSEAGRTPLHYAAAAGINPEIAAVFFEADADMNPFDNEGLTPLHYASAKTPAESVAVLLVLGASPQLVDGDGSSPLHYALRFNEDARVVRALLRLGADPNLANNEGTVPAELAVGHPAGSFALLELIAYGTEVELADGAGRTLLHQAVQHGDAEVAARLLEYGADPYAEDAFGVTPIQMALNGDLGDPARSIFDKIYQERLEEIRQSEQRRQINNDRKRLRRDELRKRREQRRAERRAKNEARLSRRRAKTGDDATSEDNEATSEDKLREDVDEIVSNEDLLKELEQVELSVRERLAQIQAQSEERRNQDN